MAKRPNKQRTGLDGFSMTQDQMLQKKNFDTVPAVIKSQNHSKERPAALTEGEFVFSVPAIIALGKGSHAEGIRILKEAHELLREESKKYLDEKSIKAAKLGD